MFLYGCLLFLLITTTEAIELNWGIDFTLLKTTRKQRLGI